MSKLTTAFTNSMHTIGTAVHAHPVASALTGVALVSSGLAVATGMAGLDVVSTVLANVSPKTLMAVFSTIVGGVADAGVTANGTRAVLTVAERGLSHAAPHTADFLHEHETAISATAGVAVGAATLMAVAAGVSLPRPRGIFS